MAQNFPAAVEDIYVPLAKDNLQATQYITKMSRRPTYVGIPIPSSSQIVVGIHNLKSYQQLGKGVATDQTLIVTYLTTLSQSALTYTMRSFQMRFFLP